MVYADKDKQREANRKAQVRFKAKRQGITDRVLPDEGITGDLVIPDSEFTRLMATLPANSENHRVSKPSDSDYVPMCETTRRFIEDQHD